MSTHQAKFTVGQLIQHNLFGYRGVIYDVDPVFMGSDDWYRQMARSRPPKDQPWYHVLVDGKEHTTYVAERNLREVEAGEPIQHPLVEEMFSGFDGKAYQRRHSVN